MNRHRVVVPCAVGVLLLFGAAARAVAAEPAAEDFYKGKQIHIILSSANSGGYYAFARLMTQYMPAHIPGHPTIIINNMEGAGGLKATNYLYNVAPRDGTYIAATHSSVPTAPLLTPDGAQFDVNKLQWIGSVTKDPFVGVVWHTAPIKSLEDAKTIDSIMGGTAVGAAGIDMAILGKEMFGLKFKIVTGYPNATDIYLAMERGEIHGAFASAWGSLKLTESAKLKDGRMRVIVQYGFSKHPELPDVPLFMDLAKTDADRQALELELARQEFSKPYFAPPDVPPARLEILRRAFDATVKEPGFLKAAEEAQLPVDEPMTGQELAALTARLSTTPTAVVKRIEDIFKKFTSGN